MNNDVGYLKYKLSKCASNVAFCETFAVTWLGIVLIRYEENLPTGMFFAGATIIFAIFGIFVLKNCKQYITKEVKKHLEYRLSLLLMPTFLFVVEITAFILVNICFPYRFTLGITVAVFGLSLYPVFDMYAMAYLLKKEANK